MTANLVATPAIPDAVQVLSGTKERKLSLRERLQKLLRQMFEGHQELLGLTPD